MKKVVKTKCPTCHSTQHTKAHFCGSCGHQFTSAKQRHFRCPHCRHPVEFGHTYCLSCGGHLKMPRKHTATHGLLYVILFLLVILVLFIFFSFPIGYTQQPSSDLRIGIPPVEPLVSIPREDVDEDTPTTIYVPSPQKNYQYTTTTSVPTSQNIKTTRGSGTKIIQFPDIVQECSYEGRWEIDSAPLRRQTRACNNAMGTFVGYADLYTQYLTNDPGVATWDTKVPTNPPSQDYDGFFLYMNTCSTEYYRTHGILDTNAISARISGFGTTQLAIDWTYRDITTKPDVRFFITLDCALQEQ